ncbi:DUF1992 domain-containing protein [Kineococcus gynurae]|uniref:DUF1992 domain-containing protein n=1 Tax=Kineococcus gynurae TaxID=452979 RepID=A0ABV5LPH3_9ACTN
MDRKPPHVTFEDWVERLVREATERGEFDGLRGAGQPLPGLDKPFSGEDWAAAKARAEDLDVSAMLPPYLAFRLERARLVESMPARADEHAVTVVVEDFNERLLAEYRRPQLGVPLATPLLDRERCLAAWRAANPAPPAPEVHPAPTDPAPRPRRWWRRRRPPG